MRQIGLLTPSIAGSASQRQPLGLCRANKRNLYGKSADVILLPNSNFINLGNLGNFSPSIGLGAGIAGKCFLPNGATTPLGPTPPARTTFSVGIIFDNAALPTSASPGGPLTLNNGGGAWDLGWDHPSAAYRGVFDVGGNFVQASFNISVVNGLYHLIGTYDGTAVNAYTNGVLQTTNAAAVGGLTNGAISITRGGWANGPRIYFIYVLPFALTAAQVLDLYNDPYQMVESIPYRSSVGIASAGTQNITLTGIASTLGIGTMSLGMNIQLTGLPSTAHIGTMQLGMNIQLAGIANVNHFGTAALGMNIQLSGLPSTAAVGVPSLIPVVTLNIQLAGIKSTLGIGVPGVRDPEAASLFGISSTISFGSMKITQDAVPTNSLIDTNIPYEWVDTSQNFQLYLYLLSVMNTLRTKDEAIIFINGNPNGVVAAKPGTIALNKGGGAGNTLWTKETGLGNTGWVNVA